jgi:hypothetical protein
MQALQAAATRISPGMNLLRQALLAICDLAHDSQCVIDSLPILVVQFYHAPHGRGFEQDRRRLFLSLLEE